jgi:hypothetical protein
MARLVVKHGHSRDTGYKEIGLCAQNTDCTVGLIVNMIGRAFVIIQGERESPL